VYADSRKLLRCSRENHGEKHSCLQWFIPSSIVAVGAVRSSRESDIGKHLAGLFPRSCSVRCVVSHMGALGSIVTSVQR